MTLRLAPILQDVAARLAGRPAGAWRTDPVGWAYALRDAAGLARADVVVSHLDPALEADALGAALADAGDWADRLADAAPLAETEPAAQAVELVRTLAGAFRGSGTAVAATLSGPCSVAAVTAPALGVGDDPDDRAELADLVGDALAALAGAYAGAGADLVIVVEDDVTFVRQEDRAAAHAPLLRAIGHQRREGVLCWPPGGGEPPARYDAPALPWDGEGEAPAARALRLAASCWAGAPAEVRARWPALLDAARASGATLVLSDGPLPGDVQPESLLAAAAGGRG